MIYSILLFCLFFVLNSLSQEGNNLNLYQNSNGYEFRYPKCWTIDFQGGVDDTVPLKAATGINLFESKNCSNPPKQQNMGGGSVSIYNSYNEKERDKYINFAKQTYSGKNAPLPVLYIKESKRNGDPAIILAEETSTHIQWSILLFCNTQEFRLSLGLGVQPTFELINKAKSGVNKLPDSQKKIFDSFKCTD